MQCTYIAQWRVEVYKVIVFYKKQFKITRLSSLSPSCCFLPLSLTLSPHSIFLVALSGHHWECQRPSWVLGLPRVCCERCPHACVRGGPEGTLPPAGWGDMALQPARVWLQLLPGGQVAGRPLHSAIGNGTFRSAGGLTAGKQISSVTIHGRWHYIISWSVCCQWHVL